jgi:hypothetical protein
LYRRRDDAVDRTVVQPRGDATSPRYLPDKANAADPVLLTLTGGEYGGVATCCAQSMRIIRSNGTDSGW